MPEPGVCPDEQLGWPAPRRRPRNVGYSLPSASLTMTVSNTPPGRASTVMRSSGVETGRPPEVGEVVGVRHAFEDELRGASKTRAKRQFGCACSVIRPALSSRLARRRPSAPVAGRRPTSPTPRPVALLVARSARCRAVASSLSKRSSQMRRCSPIQSKGTVERADLQVARSELGIPTPRDQATTFEHLEVLGDTRERHGSAPRARSPSCRPSAGRPTMARRVGSASGRTPHRADPRSWSWRELTKELVNCQVK